MMTASTETVERLALFLNLAEVVCSLGDAISSQLRSWAAANFRPGLPEGDEDGEPTAGAMGYIRDRLGSRVDDLAELLAIDPDECRAIFHEENR